MNEHERDFGGPPQKSWALRVFIAVGLVGVLMFVVAHLAGLTGSDKKSEGTSGKGRTSISGEAPQPPNPFAAKDKPLPLVRTKSAFLKEVGTKTYPKAKPPEKPSLLRWDFSGKKVYTYDYHQQVESDFGFGGRTGGQQQSISGNGLLHMKAQSNKTANMVISDLKMTMRFQAGGSGPKSMTQEVPPIVAQGVQEDGSMVASGTGTERLLQMLFPLPPKPLKVGESVDIPGTMPFNAGGSVLLATGKTKLQLKGYVTIGGHKCAHLVADLDISKLDVPKEIKGTYKLVTKGKSVVYFDLVDRCFVSAEQVLIMSVRADMPVPKMTGPGGQKPPADLPSSNKMAMDSDNLIRITRRKSQPPKPPE